MPIYDFRCTTCGHMFTLLLSVDEKDDVRCPRCRSKDVRQSISSFTAGLRRTGRRRGCGAGGPAGGG